LGAQASKLTRSEQTIPIPGFRNTKQVEEKYGTLQFGPLSCDQMQEIETILGRN
jgi:aryl-alcohol dehydrogenase-like predicted oxidoreductase